jgi:hypothetical protein
MARFECQMEPEGKLSEGSRRKMAKNARAAYAHRAIDMAAQSGWHSAMSRLRLDPSREQTLNRRFRPEIGRFSVCSPS